MARLPQPGGDEGDWGNVLNTFLTVSHNADGTLQNGSVNATTLGVGAVATAHLQNGSVTAAKLSATSPADGQVLGYSAGALSWTSPAGTPLATSSTTGTITLAGDLGGTAAAPTVPGLASKVDTNDARLSDQRTPVDLSVTTMKLSAGAGTDGQVLSYNAGNLLWTTASSTTVSDAGAGVKGILALSGDLSGTAAAPTVPGLATKAADNAVVHLAGSETVSGVKTFSASPIVPTPTTGTQAATKAYVDAAAGSGGAAATTTTLGTIQLAGALGGTATAPTVPGLATKVDTSDARLTDTRTPSDASVTPVKLNAVAAPTSGQVLSYNGTKFNWIAAPSGGGGGNGYTFTIVHKSASYTAAAYDMVFIDDVTAGAVTITLPTPTANSTVRVKRLAPNGNGVQVAAPAGSYIDAASGVGTDTLNNQFQSQDYWSDGSNWYRI